MKQRLVSNHGNLRTKSPLESSAPLIQETKGLLHQFPEAEKQYNSALEKFQKGIYERNALDDLRLSLELLLKAILVNDKSLENQRPVITAFLKDKGVATEVASMLWTLIDQYAKYQNHNIKHNDNVDSREMELILDLTTTFMKHLLIHA